MAVSKLVRNQKRFPRECEKLGHVRGMYGAWMGHGWGVYRPSTPLKTFVFKRFQPLAECSPLGPPPLFDFATQEFEKGESRRAVESSSRRVSKVSLRLQLQLPGRLQLQLQLQPQRQLPPSLDWSPRWITLEADHKFHWLY